MYLESCLAYRINGYTKSGIYNILPDPYNKSFEVWCDMVNEGGGWTVLLKRISGLLSFEKGWDEYKNGFGKLDESFWLGNDYIHEVTNSPGNDLVNAVDKTFTIRYDNFHVFNESTNYLMNYGDYIANLSNAGDCFTKVKKTLMFSTHVRDNDLSPASCLKAYGNGGWWFSHCHFGYMTGRYMQGFDLGNTWCQLNAIIVKRSELKTRKSKLTLFDYG